MARMFEGMMVTDDDFDRFMALAAEEFAKGEAEPEPEPAVEPKRKRTSRKAAEAAIAEATGKTVSLDDEAESTEEDPE